MLTVGSSAPGFTAPDQDGEVQSLAQYKGRRGLLYFYPEDDTSGCTTQACGLRDSYPELKDKVVILGVSPDTIESHKKFQTKYHLPFTLLADPDGTIISAYGIRTDFPKRTSFLIDGQEKIEKIYSGVVPEEHVKQVMADL